MIQENPISILHKPSISSLSAKTSSLVVLLKKIEYHHTIISVRKYIVGGSFHFLGYVYILILVQEVSCVDIVYKSVAAAFPRSIYF